MTPPSRTRSEHPLLIHRRDFLKKATGAVAVLSLGGLSACGDDDFDGPAAAGYTVWLAQRVSGIVQHSVTQDPIAGASVILTMGFDPDHLFEFAGGKTSSEGGFDFQALEETGKSYWFLQREDELPVQVYMRLRVQHGSFWPAFPQREFTRTPSRDEPTRLLHLYTFNFSVPMIQVTE